MIRATHQHRRPRVLLQAFACCPGKGSEAGVGWNRAIETAKYCDTWVIAEESESAPGVREFIEENGEIPGLHFEFVSEKAYEHFMWRLPGLGYLSLNLWNRRAYRAARRLHEEVGFDLVHQTNFCTFREPGYLWKLDVPFVWGPFGGSQNFPWRFLGQAGIWGGIREATRSALNWIQLRTSRRVRRAARKAAAVLVSNSTNQRDLAEVHGVASSVLIDAGISGKHGSMRAGKSGSETLRILWAGLLTNRKALGLLIEALAKLPDDIPYELHVAGAGPCRARWQRLAKRLGVDQHMTWIGHEPLEEHLRRYDWADVFVFSSLRDTTGTVVMEALGAGLPVICLDHQGASDMVTEESGIKIPVTNPCEVIDRLADALCSLRGDSGRLSELSRGALQRARYFHWSRQAEEIAAVYDRVLDDNSPMQEALR